MKILLVHNFYGSSAPSGENTVFQAECDLLRKNGHTVIEFTRHSDEIRNQGFLGLLKGAFSTPWNPFSLKTLQNVLEEEKPDIMHAHNFFPLISPSIFYAAKSHNVPIVFTLHNYRILCANAILLRDSTPCTECLDNHSILPSLKYKCYRKSRLATLPLAFSIKLHQQLSTWQKKVDAFISLTEFQKNKLVESGLPAEKIYIKPHFYKNPPNTIPFNQRRHKTVFIGRLGPEKGIDILLKAWKMWGKEAPSLEIIGDGSERRSLERYSANNNLSNKVFFLGQLTFPQVQEILSSTRLLVFPTLCFEGFPMIIREAFALGVPVAASRLGAIADIVENEKNGVLFTPGDAQDLFKKVSSVWKQTEKLAEMATNAHKEFENRYTEEKNYEILIGIYKKAMNTN